MKTIFNATVKQYKGHWLIKAFRDGAIVPPVKGGSKEVISAVRGDSGAIGYVWEEDARGQSGIKVLLILNSGT